MAEATADVILPALQAVRDDLAGLAESWKEVPMLARTHGQPASPVMLGKEFAVFVERLDHAIAQFEAVPFAAKFGGATGGFNAHHVAYPEVDWHGFAETFVLFLCRQETSINPQAVCTTSLVSLIKRYIQNPHRLMWVVLYYCFEKPQMHQSSRQRNH